MASALFAQTTGSITGAVYDGQTGRPIVGAIVAINGQSSDQNHTGSDGKFTVPVSPGTYTLRFTAENYAEVVVSDVVVKAGEAVEASTVMTNKSLVTTVNVVEKANPVGATAEATLQERRLSAVVSDSISREELSAGTSGDAAGALEKVTGVSVVGDGFVYVRGLGERYSATMLNSAMIPTTEPEKRVVPLDLFPTGMIESIKILKTYSPDLPSEFAGGLVQMTTVDFPAQRMFQVSAKTGFNTVTSFDNFSTYPGGSYDFLGFGKGARGIPSAIPSDKRLFPGNFTPVELQSLGRAFSDNWQPTSIGSMRPSLDWSMVAGGTFGRFGLVGAVSFSNAPQRQSEFQRYLRQGGNGPIVFTEYPQFDEYNERARLGAVFNAAIRLNSANKILFRNTITHEAEKEARTFSGYDGGLDANISSERLHYVERDLLSTSVEGDHSFQTLRNSVIHWQMTYSQSSRNEPDLREVFRGLLPNGKYIFTALGSSGIRFFSDLQDRIYEPQVDYSIPFFKGKITGLWKTGFRATVRRRDFQARRFRYIPQGGGIDLYLPSNELFGPDNITPNRFQIVEYTRGTDTYSALNDIYAGYSMVDLGIGSRWRIVAGLRIESADMNVVTLDNRVPNANPTTASLSNIDPTPGVNVIYALNPRQNLRVSYSRTLSRPDFRELSPFDFNNVLGGFVTQGNPNLKRASIQNTDVRWEMFPGGNQLLAASFFVKSFNQPIETTILPSNDLRQSFVNAAGALNYGVELEFRRGLGSFSKKLRDFAVSTNFTFVNSNIDIKPEDVSVLTSTSRPLVGQSRYIANAILEWRKPSLRSNARFDTNYVSRRISDVGTFRLPDIYQEANTFVDVVYEYSFDEKGRYKLRVEGENLSDNRYHWTQGDFLQRSYRLGRTFQVGFSYSFF
jgi:outer membrane receptor protein involved in Fe transport